MSNTAILLEKRKKYVPNALGIFCPAGADHASGAFIYDPDGRELIDFAGGIGVLNAGHCPEPVVAAIREQAGKLIHSCFNVAIYDVYLDLAEKLATLFPHGNDGAKVMLVNTGAEAVENAVKIARQATGRSGILCFEGGFHGRTMMAMTLTSKVGYKTGCGPFAPDVYRLPYPTYGAREEVLFESPENHSSYHIANLKHFFHTQVPANQIAAVIVEVVQGEGGFQVISRGYLEELRKICTENGILLILDEVQSGFGRTGAWAGYHHFNVTPDLSTWAKSMGSGMPIGCVIGKQSVMDAINPGTIGGTYAGNPVCAAAALATLRYMEEIDIVEKGKAVGAITRERLENMRRRFPTRIREQRGLGAMLAIELVRNSGEPDADATKKIIHRCHEKGLIIISAGVYGNVLRILSPLVIAPAVLNRGMDILESVLEEVFTETQV